jgi:hypothetical protein
MQSKWLAVTLSIRLRPEYSSLHRVDRPRMVEKVTRDRIIVK